LTTLLVGNLPVSTTSASLLAMFAEFNPVSATVQIRDSGHGPQALGCVVLPNIFSALTAISVLNNKQMPGQPPLSVMIGN
jgi:hypothetical protein